MTHEQLDEFVTEATQDVTDRYLQTFGQPVTTSQEQEISDHLWFIFCGLVREETK